jgi:hypothetical protein
MSSISSLFPGGDYFKKYLIDPANTTPIASTVSSAAPSFKAMTALTGSIGDAATSGSLTVLLKNSVMNTVYYTTTDMGTFTARTFPNSKNYHYGRICYGNGVFVLHIPSAAWGDNGFTYTSTDGMAWTYRTTHVPDSGYNTQVVKFVNGTFFLIGARTDGIYKTSTDGITWTSRYCAYMATDIAGYDTMDINWDGTRFLFSLREYQYGTYRYIIYSATANFSGASAFALPTSQNDGTTVVMMNLLMIQGKYVYLHFDGSSPSTRNLIIKTCSLTFTDHITLWDQAINIGYTLTSVMQGDLILFNLSMYGGASPIYSKYNVALINGKILISDRYTLPAASYGFNQVECFNKVYWVRGGALGQYQDGAKFVANPIETVLTYP